VEHECDYQYKPCDCRDYLKFKPKEQPRQSAQVIQFPVKSGGKILEKGSSE